MHYCGQTVKLNTNITKEKVNTDLSIHPNSTGLICVGTCFFFFLFDRLDIFVFACLRSLRLGCLWTSDIMLVSERDDKMPLLPVAASDYIVRVGVLALNSCPSNPPPHHHLPSLWATVFPSSRFSIVNEEDRWERGLLVLIYPGGSLGITINSQLLAHGTGLHRHCQFVPIRGWVCGCLL